MKYEYYKKEPISLFKAILRSITLFFLGIVIFVVGVMSYCNLFLSYYPVSGGSMRPLINATYDRGDFVYATKNIGDVTYGDIIIYQKTEQTLVIKRVIAMGNDNLMLKEDNGEYAIYLQYNSTGEWQKLEEDYIYDKSYYNYTYSKLYHTNPKDTIEHIPASQFLTDENSNKYYHIDEGEIFYAGDNRLTSNDCFNYGSVSQENLVAKVVYLIHKDEPRIWQVIMQFLGIYKWR